MAVIGFLETKITFCFYDANYDHINLKKRGNFKLRKASQNSLNHVLFGDSAKIFYLKYLKNFPLN